MNSLALLFLSSLNIQSPEIISKTWYLKLSVFDVPELRLHLFILVQAKNKLSHALCVCKSPRPNSDSMICSRDSQNSEKLLCINTVKGYRLTEAMRKAQSKFQERPSISFQRSSSNGVMWIVLSSPGNDARKMQGILPTRKAYVILVVWGFYWGLVTSTWLTTWVAEL